MSNENDLMGVNGMGGLSNDPAMHPFGVIPDGSIPDAGSNLTDEQAEQPSRNNSIKRLSTGGGRDGRSMAGSVPGDSSRNSFDQSYAGAIASTMPSGMNPSLAFNMPHGQNGHSYSQGYDYSSHGNSANVHPQSSATQDWSQMFQPSAPEGFMSQYNPVTNSNIPIKTEYIKPEPSLNNSSNGLFTGIYPGTNTTMTATSLPSWNFQNDPLEEISSRLLYLCFSNNQIVISKRSNDLRMYLSANNIKHFLENYTNFQGHFPVIHMPTFRIGEAFDGLLLGMICIGAVYSDRMTSTEVREMMELAKVVVERNSRVFSIISREQNVSLGNGTIGQNAPFGNETIGATKSELEEITAIFMMQVLFTWHGTPLQREKARQEFPLVAEIARRSELTRPMSTSPFSVLHQPNVKVENFNAASFDWNAWVEQEKRSRLMFTIFLVDASMVVYFNIPPRFERDEIRLPLPADDAAWDATSSAECADALGLNGPVAARSRNPEGSRRPKQPEMHTALKALMHNVWDLQPGTTNVYSKFILVHALHIQLWIAQRQISLQELGQPTPLAYLSSGTSTPISQNDWIRGIDTTRSGSQSANTSGRVTPVEANGQSSQLLMTISNAFEKWKKAWDEDMATQYPPSSTHYRRFGFCRDSVAFYYLSRLLTQNKGMDWQMAPDQRFSLIIQMLKTVKGYVVTDSAKRGEALGSVSDVDSNYAVSDLTLDMAQLFKPINKQIDSPVQGVHMSISNGMV
jgi:hypothetical protein